MNQKILTQVNKLFKNDGLHDTFLNDVKIYSTSKYDPFTPSIIDLCLILVLQGKKVSSVGENIVIFDIKNYLVVPTTLPFECKTYASEDEPFIGLVISLNKTMMYDIISRTAKKESMDTQDNCIGVFSDNVTSDIENLTQRLVTTLQSKEESEILGEQILRELFYRVSIGKNSNFLHKMFLNNNNEAKIARILKTMHTQSEINLDITNLAKQEDMSISSFHTHFKNITSHTPLQYMKKVRLNRAKDLMMQHNYKVAEAARKLGYESASQFSRDFKTYFGYPPKDVKSPFEEDGSIN